MTTQAEALSDTPMFRVDVDWRGGGLSYTLPFPDEEAATRWALGKAKGHPGAIVNVEKRAKVAGSQPFTESDYEEADRTTKPAKVANELARAAAHELGDNPFNLTGWK